MGLFNLFKKNKSKQKKVKLDNTFSREDFYQMNYKRDFQILHDSKELLLSTNNPSVFFSRYDLFYEKLNNLVDDERKGYIEAENGTYKEYFDVVSKDDFRNELIKEFIDRSWNKTCVDASELKTQRGINNRINKYKTEMSEFDDHIPNDYIDYYMSLSYSDWKAKFQKLTKPSGYIDRRKYNDEIDRAQRLEASPEFKKKVIDRYYKDYLNKPYISKDRELYVNDWFQQADLFPNSIIPRKTMERFDDGLLPGNVYMLYWINKYPKKKKIPGYFEYRYGIDFMKELIVLKSSKYLDENNKLTEKGLDAINKHVDVINEHRLYK